MLGLPGRISRFALITIAVLAMAGTAFWAAHFGASSAAPPDTYILDAFADRFPAALNQAALQSVPPPAWLAALDGTEQRLSLFSPHPAYPMTSASFASEMVARSPSDPTSTGAISNASAAAAHNANRKPTVFNDAQIASIKKRLNLTKEQEEYWPAVEAMLRRLAWKKTPENAHGKTIPIAERRLAALDVNGADLARLQSTTGRLLMSFNEDQKRELQMLAHLVGLQDVFSKL
jgi:hypothetical protein